jgi:predicted RNase H-like HicB family nuclease
MMLHFPIKLEPDDNGSLLVTCALLPEVTSFGDDEADALRHAADAIEEALGSVMDWTSRFRRHDPRGHAGVAIVILSLCR